MPAKSRTTRYADSAAAGGLGLLEDVSILRKLKKKTNVRLDVEAVEAAMMNDLLPYQRVFVSDFQHKYCGFCAGYGSGKTFSAVIKSILLAFRSQGFTHLFLEPTIPLLRDVALPTWFKVLDTYAIPYVFRSSPLPNITLKLPGGDTPVFLRSLETYQRLVGVNAASLTADEIDTTKAEIVHKAMVKLQGRVRVGNCPQICTVSTPEGFGWMYNFYVTEDAENKKLYRGRTRDNPHLDPNFITDLEQKFHPDLVKSYLEGEFCNLESSVVFYEFDRQKHSTGIFHPEPGERIVFGADFNVNRCQSIFAVIRPGPTGQQVHMFSEEKAADTFDMVSLIKRKYPRHLANGMVTCYPDASGSHTATASTTTDHDILRQAGINVITEKRNPPIAETLAHANLHIHNNLVFINPTTCVDTISSLEQWVYDKSTMKPAKNGANDKSHCGDAVRYLLWNVLPRAGMRAGYGPRWR